FIANAAAEARAAGVGRLIGLPLAPHYARMSLGGYQKALQEAWDRELVFVPGFHDHPSFIRAVQGLLREALAAGRPERLFFTAHLGILFDLDVEAQAFAREKGLRIRRTASFNTRPEFIGTLADIVGDVLVRVA